MNKKDKQKQTKSMHLEETLHEDVRVVAYQNGMQLTPFVEKVLIKVIADEKLLKKILK